MPAGVKDSIAGAVQKFGGFGEEESKDYLNQLEKEGRIVEECWS
jgi:sulfite reductase alpha subunit-like flavoprotein